LSVLFVGLVMESVAYCRVSSVLELYCMMNM
jgi:hypothetical protein